MYLPTRSADLQRSQMLRRKRNFSDVASDPLDHRARVRRELKSLGVSWAGIRTMESEYLPGIIHTNEHIGGVVYGHHEDGFAMLVATDKRIIFLDKKPMFVNEDEINYFVVSGVSFGHAGFWSTVTLHTRVKEFTIRTLNRKCADNFIKYIESRCLEHDYQGAKYDQPN